MTLLLGSSLESLAQGAPPPGPGIPEEQEKKEVKSPSAPIEQQSHSPANPEPQNKIPNQVREQQVESPPQNSPTPAQSPSTNNAPQEQSVSPPPQQPDASNTTPKEFRLYQNPDELQLQLPPKLSKEEYKQKSKAWEKLQKKGEEAFYLCQYGVAERSLKKAVLLAREFGPGEVRFAKSSGELGRLLTVRRRFEEAEKYLQEELALINMAYDGDKSKMVKAMGAMVSFYLNYGTTEKAYPLAEDLVDFIEGKIREQRSQKSRKVTLKQGAPLQAWAGMAKPEDRDPLLEWSIVLDRLGYQFRVKKELDLADRLFKAALDIKATVLGKKHLSLANSYDKLGTVCMARKEYDEAESYYKDALSITERILNPGDPKIYNRIYKLAWCYTGAKKYSQAIAMYQRARREFGGNRGLQQQILYKLGCLYSDQRNFGAATPVLRQALNLAIKNNGYQSINIVPYLKKYAYVSYYSGNKGKMNSLRARANNIAPPVKAIKPKVEMKAGAWSQKDAKQATKSN